MRAFPKSVLLAKDRIEQHLSFLRKQGNALTLTLPQRERELGNGFLA